MQFAKKKLSKFSPGRRNCSLPKLAHFLLRHRIYHFHQICMVVVLWL